MCDVATEQKIRDTVSDFVNRGIMFTPYDVTKTIRADGTRISHKDVQEVVRSMYSGGEMGIYERDTVDVGAPVKPNLYYHPNTDINTYDKDWVENNPKQSVSVATPTPTPTPTPVSASVSASVSAPVATLSNVETKVVPTKEGRIEIPTAMVKMFATPNTPIKLEKACSINPNGKVSKIIVEVPASGGGSYRVSKDYRLRLHVSHLAAHLGVKPEYSVSTENGKVIIG